MKLGQLCKKIGSGATPRGGKEVYLNQGPVSLIRSQNVHNNEFSFSGLAYINELQARELQNVEVEENDLLLNITGDSVARICQVDLNALPARVNQHVSIIRPHPEKLDHLFLKYWFLLPATQQLLLQLSSSGATRKALTKQMLESLDIPDILLNSQKMISNLLYRFDQKIELNRKMNETLEEMAQAVFQDWFVDFGPVKRKAKGITNPVAILGGLIPNPAQAQEIANLFPDQFAEDGLPEGWSIREIGKIVSVVGGSTPSTSNTDYWCDKTDGYNWATPKDISKLDGLYLFDTDRHISQKGLDKISSGLLPVGTVLLSSRAPIGYLAITGVPTAVNQGFIGLIPSKKMPASMLYFWCKENMEEIKIRANGSTFMEISKTNFRPIPTILASDEIIDLYDEISNNYLNLIQLNLLQNRTLAEMRDLLLPKLMSGEISVDDLEKKMGGVL